MESVTLFGSCVRQNQNSFGNTKTCFCFFPVHQLYRQKLASQRNRERECDISLVCYSIDWHRLRILLSHCYSTGRPTWTWGLDCISTSSGGILCPLMHLSMSFSYMPLGTGGLVVVPARRSAALTLLFCLINATGVFPLALIVTLEHFRFSISSYW